MSYGKDVKTIKIENPDLTEVNAQLAEKANKQNAVDWINVKELGAKGDGITDDTAVFQNALANYKVVYVPSGTYLISATLNIASKQLLGAGKATTTLKTVSNITLLNLSGWGAIDNFTLLNENNGNTATAVNAGGQNCSIKNLYIKEFYNGLISDNNGLYFCTIENIYIRNNTVMGNIGFWLKSNADGSLAANANDVKNVACVGLMAYHYKIHGNNNSILQGDVSFANGLPTSVGINVTGSGNILKAVYIENLQHGARAVTFDNSNTACINNEVDLYISSGNTDFYKLTNDYKLIDMGNTLKLRGAGGNFVFKETLRNALNYFDTPLLIKANNLVESSNIHPYYGGHGMVSPAKVLSISAEKFEGNPIIVYTATSLTSESSLAFNLKNKNLSNKKILYGFFVRNNMKLDSDGSVVRVGCSISANGVNCSNLNVWTPIFNIDSVGEITDSYTTGSAPKIYLKIANSSAAYSGTLEITKPFIYVLNEDYSPSVVTRDGGTITGNLRFFDANGNGYTLNATTLANLGVVSS